MRPRAALPAGLPASPASPTSPWPPQALFAKAAAGPGAKVLTPLVSQHKKVLKAAAAVSRQRRQRCPPPAWVPAGAAGLASAWRALLLPDSLWRSR